MDVPYWKFGGSTVVSSNYVRLTPDRQSKKGIIWNTVVSDGGCYPIDSIYMYCVCYSVVVFVYCCYFGISRYTCTTGRSYYISKFMDKERACLGMDLLSGMPRNWESWVQCLVAGTISLDWPSSLILTVITMENTV